MSAMDRVEMVWVRTGIILRQERSEFILLVHSYSLEPVCFTD